MSQLLPSEVRASIRGRNPDRRPLWRVGCHSAWLPHATNVAKDPERMRATPAAESRTGRFKARRNCCAAFCRVPDTEPRKVSRIVPFRTRSSAIHLHHVLRSKQVRNAKSTRAESSPQVFNCRSQTSPPPRRHHPRQPCCQSPLQSTPQSCLGLRDTVSDPKPCPGPEA